MKHIAIGLGLPGQERGRLARRYLLFPLSGGRPDFWRSSSIDDDLLAFAGLLALLLLPPLPVSSCDSQDCESSCCVTVLFSAVATTSPPGRATSATGVLAMIG